MRCFIAIDFNQFSDFFKEFQAGIAYSKCKFPETFHCTLRFLGDVDDAGEIMRQLEIVKSAKFRLETSGIGFFPSQDYIKVVWMGLEGNIQNLKNKIDDALGYKREKFVPHITLARVKFINDKDRFLENIKKTKYEKKEVLVKSFQLVQSTLTKTGPVYDVIAEFEI